MSELVKEILYLAGALVTAFFGVLTMAAARDILKDGPRKVAHLRKSGYSLFKGTGFRSKVTKNGAVQFSNNSPLA
ncbi:MAG: hypothetical protein AB202_01645 [Parcubacteria bacterium C7867-007]|nr:MAG: hypothetical protein AB202_01645 [Parcubacteria bacterium C7867-007]